MAERSVAAVEGVLGLLSRLRSIKTVMVSFERRKPQEMPIDPEITADLLAADQEARLEVAERGAELLDHLRRL
jgi:hypothetical protein